jgi:hypothetical protein
VVDTVEVGEPPSPADVGADLVVGTVVDPAVVEVVDTAVDAVLEPVSEVVVDSTVVDVADGLDESPFSPSTWAPAGTVEEARRKAATVPTTVIGTRRRVRVAGRRRSPCHPADRLAIRRERLGKIRSIR